MKYVFLDAGMVAEVIPEYVEGFPNIGIEQRYEKNFIDKLMPVDDSVVVEKGYLYDFEKKEFYVPEGMKPEEVPTNIEKQINDINVRMADIENAMCEQDVSATTYAKENV